MTFLDAKLQGFGGHAGYRHGLNITKHLTNLKMFHLSRFNLHVNEKACHREEGSNTALDFWHFRSLALIPTALDFSVEAHEIISSIRTIFKMV